MKKILKIFFEKIMYLLFSTSNKNIVKIKIDKHKYISFDIFDTLIKRNVKEPTDVFDIVEKKYNETHKNKIKDFKSTRIRAEKEALKHTTQEETNLDEIYSKISIYSVGEKKTLKQLELETEYNLCTTKKIGKELFEYCKSKNKTIIITSDMYLTEEFIKKILKKNNYEGYKYLYISSKEKVTKRSGNIYIKILDNLKIKKNEIMHIGDNPRSDYINAKKNKIESVLIKKSEGSFNDELFN